MIIYRAQSLKAAATLDNHDPMHSSGTRSFTICRWLVNEGSLQLDIKRSTQLVRL